MYASDITHRKRAQAVYLDVLQQKKLFNEGKISRMTYQNGGTDYSYLMELEQGCIGNTCPADTTLNFLGGVAPNLMDLTYATYLIPGTEYGYELYVDSSGNTVNQANPNSWTIRQPLGQGNSILLTSYTDSSGNTIALPSSTRPPISYLTSDDVFFPLPIGSMIFKFFGKSYTNNQLYWSTNCAIIFGDSTNSYIDPRKRLVSVRSSPYPAVLLGDGDRRLDKLFVRDDSIEGKFSIFTLLVFYEGFTQQLLCLPNTAQMQVRLIRELTGFNRQWIEVSTKLKPLQANGDDSPGYTANQITTDSAIDSNGNVTNNLPADPNLLSPYNITDGTEFYNPCGTTFSTKCPDNGSSFTFEGTGDGYNWVFRNNTYVPIPAQQV
jgi:hypothetical protein